MVGAINGIVIVGGRLQPFIVTLAMMVTALGVARLTAGQNNAVLPVYTGSNAVAEFDMLRSLVFGIVPVPGLFFLAAVLIYGAVLRFTDLRALRLRDRRQRGGGAALGHRRRADQDRDLRDLGHARRRRGGALRGAVPPGQARRRRRARARRHRRGGDRRHQPDGRARADGGHARRRADLRAAVEPPAAAQHQLEPSAGAEGADHRRRGADPGAQPRRDHGEPAPAGPAGGATEPAASARPEGGGTESRELGGSA